MKGQGRALERDWKGGGFYPPRGGGALPPKIQCFVQNICMSKPPIDPPASYEAAMEELEQLTSRIESGQLPLEQLLAGYQRGAELLKFCRDKLQAVEEQIKVLDAGVLKPWASE
jgi:exodeoxyribonuclease VII small subunit